MLQALFHLMVQRAMGRHSHRRCLSDGVRLAVRFGIASEFQESNHVDDEIRLWGGPNASTNSYVFLVSNFFISPNSMPTPLDPEEEPLHCDVLSLYPFS
jgi:hypothetical protein